MTEQETEAWRERLRRVWGGIPASEHPRLLSDSETVNTIFQAFFSKEAHLRVFLTSRRRELIFNLIYEWDGLKIGLLGASYDTGLSEPVYLLSPPYCSSAEQRAGMFTEEFAQFAAQWSSFLHRGCWLSGCPIEASAHEKAEWIQGFTREEIQAWNLKM